MSVDFWTHGLSRPELRAQFDANVHRLCDAIAAELSFGTADERRRIAHLLVALTDGLLLHMSHGAGPSVEELGELGDYLRSGRAS